jgi:protein phosphatase
MRTRFAGATDIGMVRDHNEDSLFVSPEHHVVAVADGMGGHRSGDVASQLCVETLNEFFALTVAKDATWPFPLNLSLTDEENYLVTSLRLANRRIFAQSQRTAADFGMGTTAVVAIFDASAKHVSIGHVGDSRCYRLRDGQITQLTRDHSLVSDAATMAPWMSAAELSQLPSNVITRALGIRDDVTVDLRTEETQEDDVYLLCSDGLSGMLSDDRMLEIVASAASLDEACEELLLTANQAGGIDNITVVLAKVEKSESDERPASVRPSATSSTPNPPDTDPAPREAGPGTNSPEGTRADKSRDD